MELSELRHLLPAGEPAYRAEQVYRAIYQQKVSDLVQISTLPGRIRTALAGTAELGLPVLDRRFESVDGTRRYLLRLSDGRTVETVLMPEGDRDTVCISSQVGCPVDCKFCMTALLGLERNLTAGEIVGQVLVVARDNDLRKDGGRLNIVMMGQGEPLLNFDSVTAALRILLDPKGVAISPKHATLSTSGIVPGIERLGKEEVRPHLAISLNASNDEQRNALMPINRKYPLATLMTACQEYPLRSWEYLMFEYVMLGGVNDSLADARRVVKLLAPLKAAKVNLIPWNPGQLPYHESSVEDIDLFQKLLIERGIPTFVRHSRGRDVMACLLYTS